MKVEKLDHVHVYVKDLEKAIKLYEDILGEKASGFMIEQKDHVKCVIFPCGVELISSLTPDGPVARAIAAGGEGLKAISFKVTDIDKAKEDLKSKGLRMVGEVAPGKLREILFHPKDACGVMIEINQQQMPHHAYLAFHASDEEDKK